MRHVWQILSSFLFYHGDLPKVIQFFYSRAGNRMSSPNATSLLYGSDFLCFLRTSTDVYLTGNNGYIMVAARITDPYQSSISDRVFVLLLSFSSPLVLLHVLSKPVRIIPEIVLGTSYPSSIHPSGQ